MSGYGSTDYEETADADKEDHDMPLDSAAGAPDRMFKENLIFPVLSTPWKIYLLITIGTGTVRFGVLRRSLPSISRVSVTKYLTELERDGFLFRMEYPKSLRMRTAGFQA